MRSYSQAPHGRRRHARRTVASAFLLALALLAITSAPALAVVGHSLLRTFSTGAGSGPRSLATDSAGNVYVVEFDAGRIAKFDSAGNPVPFSGSAPYISGNTLTGTPAGPFNIANFTESVIAVDRSGGPNDGYIYFARNESDTSGELLVFDPTGAYKGRLGPRGNYYCGVAVNQASGEVYVTDYGSSSVRRYPTPVGDPSLVAPNGTLHTRTCMPAVDSSGTIYVGQPGTPVLKYQPSQFDLPSPTPAAEYQTIGPYGLAVDPVSDDFYIDSSIDIVKRNAAGVVQGPAFGSLYGSRGITADGTGNVLVADLNGGVFVYGPNQVELPLGTTGGSTNFTVKSATVEGSANPDGAGTITACEFRYGPDSGYSEGSAPCVPAAPIGSTTAVSANLTGLTPGTTYHYQLFLTNANGTQAGGDQSFTTVPSVENLSTAPASAVKKDSADLNASFTGGGLDTHYYFEWGLTPSYGNTVPAPPGNDAGSGTGPQNVAPVHISGLKATTTYHYRVVASNSIGSTRGQDETFTTADAVTNLTADPPVGITNTTAELAASFDGDGSYETHYYFEWGTTTAYGKTAPVPPGNAVAPGTGRINVSPVPISGLLEGAAYHFRFVASNETGKTVSADRLFYAAESPAVGNLSTRNVTASSAELAAEINPHSGPTTYRFEWGNTTAYGNSIPVPDASAGSGASPVPVRAQLEGLVAGVTYHFRLVATNAYGTTRTVDQSFGFYPPNCPNAQVRQETQSNTLPDCRAYELVTPSFAQGTFIYPERGPAAPLATSPSRLAYAGNVGTFPEEAGEPSNVLGDLYVSTRSDAGWYQKFIGRPATDSFMMGGPPANYIENLFQFHTGQPWFVGTQASPDLSKVISYDLGWPSNNPFEQQAKPSNAPYVWESSTGKLLERWPSNLSQVSDGEDFVGWPHASTDVSHFVFQSNLPFAPGGTEVAREIECCGFLNSTQLPPASIYDNDLNAGKVVLASIKGDDSTTFQGYVFDISEDGSQILMSEKRASAPGEYSVVESLNDVPGPLYLRADGEHTYEIAPGHQITYVDSSGDGKTVYLRSAEQLTPDDHDNSTDLFVWHESDEKLVRVSVGDAGESGNSESCNASWSGGGCNVGLFSRAAESEEVWDHSGVGNEYNDTSVAADNGDIYFLSPEQLLEGRGQQGQANLYLYRGGSLRFVTSLNAEPSPLFRMEVSPDGDHMAFVTRSNATAYDSAGHTEMYTYSPATGRVVCASCRPDGQPPISDVQASQNGLFQTYDGRAFFSTDDPLVPRDTDGVQDIYEFTEGRAQLISSGVGSVRPYFDYSSPTGFVSVSANGTDVYFSTVDNLVSQDHNGGALKIYDARTGGGFAAERTPEKCTAADECHGPGAAPPSLPPDRTSANLGHQAKSKAHKAKKHKKKTHRKATKKKTRKKAKAPRANGKQGRAHHG